MTKNVYKHPEHTIFQVLYNTYTPGTQPMIVGGWNNLNMQSILMYDECKGDDLTRAGKWVFDRRKAMSKGREKFVTISAPSYMIPTNKR